MELWKAVQSEIKKLSDLDDNLTHIQINYQIRDYKLIKNKAVIDIKFKE